MKIVENVERECCQLQDRKPYKGLMVCLEHNISPSTRRDFSFCVHCGQIWAVVREMMPSGGREPVLKRVKLQYMNLEVVNEN